MTIQFLRQLQRMFVDLAVGARQVDLDALDGIIAAVECAGPFQMDNAAANNNTAITKQNSNLVLRKIVSPQFAAHACALRSQDLSVDHPQFLHRRSRAF